MKGQHIDPTPEEPPQPGIDDGEIRERAEIVAKIWEMLPLPLRPEFYVFYRDAGSVDELTRRLQVIEDVLFDFLSPLENTVDRAERAGTAHTVTGERKHHSDTFPLFSYWANSAIDWDMLRQEILERILSVPEKPVSVNQYHGRGSSSKRFTVSNRSKEVDASGSPRELSRRPKTDGNIQVNLMDHPSHPWRPKGTEAGNGGAEPHSFHITGDIEDGSSRRAWEPYGLPSVVNTQSIEAPHVIRKFDRLIASDEVLHNRIPSTETSFINRRHNTKAWNRSALSQTLYNRDYIHLEPVRDGVRRFRTMRGSEFSKLPQSRAICSQCCQSNNDRYPRSIQPPLVSPSATDTVPQPLDKEGLYWRLLSWGNFKSAIELLAPEKPSSNTHDEYGTPFMQIISYLVHNAINLSQEEQTQFMDDLPPELLGDYDTMVPLTCAMTLSIDWICFPVHILVHGLKPIDVAMRIAEACNCRCFEAAAIRSMAVHLSRYLLVKTHPKLNVNDVDFYCVRPCRNSK